MKKYLKRVSAFLLVGAILISTLCFMVSAESWIVPSSTATVVMNNSVVTITVLAHDESTTVSADISSFSFPNASVVNMTGTTYSTASIVENGKIFFKAPAGTYTLTQNAKTVTSLIGNGVSSTNYTGLNYKGDGTASNPYTILSDFSSDAFSASWKSMNFLAGFDINGVNSTRLTPPLYGTIEYRNTQTGFLNASIFIDGSKWAFTPSADKGPYGIGYVINPNSTYINTFLSAHTLFSGTFASNLAPAVAELSGYLTSADTLLFLEKANGGIYKGPLTYKLYVGDKFSAGDVLEMNYITGVGDLNKFHGTKPTVEQAQQMDASCKLAYGQYIFVDSNGYITFDLNNGGFFTFTKTDSMTTYSDLEDTINGLDKSLYTTQSYNSLETALTNYKNIIQTKTEYSEMTSALDALTDAYGALELKPIVSVVETPTGITNPSFIHVDQNGVAFNAPVDLKINSDAATKQAIEEALSEQAPMLPKDAVVFPLDISFFSSGTDTKIQPNSGTSVKIRVPVPTELLVNKESIVVVCIINGKLTVLDTKIVEVDGVYCVEFTASHFSPYAFVVDTNKQILAVAPTPTVIPAPTVIPEPTVTVTPTANPTTGDVVNFFPFAIVALGSLTILYLKKKRKN